MLMKNIRGFAKNEVEIWDLCDFLMVFSRKMGVKMTI
jgi:hypothetical protein